MAPFCQISHPCPKLLCRLSACQYDQLRRELADKKVIIPGLVIKNGSCAAEVYGSPVTHRYDSALEVRRAAQGWKRSWPQSDTRSNRPLLADKGVIESLSAALSKHSPTLEQCIKGCYTLTSKETSPSHSLAALDDSASKEMIRSLYVYLR